MSVIHNINKPSRGYHISHTIGVSINGLIGVHA